jgi:hypothetical protein
LAFGTTLFNTGADLLGGYGRGLVSSLAPFQGYLGAAGDIEALGQQPLELGAALGGRIANPQGGAALQAGGQRAAEYMFGANQLNPTASFLQGLSTNQDFTRGVQNLFGGRQLTPADQYRLAQWNASQSEYMSPGYMGP